MVLTNTNSAIWYLQETHHAGGVAGVELAQTHPPAVDSLTRVNVLAGDIKFKGVEFIRSRIKAPGMPLGQAKIVTTGKEFPEMEFTYYPQANADPFKAVVKGGTQGSKGTSYIFQVRDPDPDESEADDMLHYNLFGCQLTSYVKTGSIESKIPPKVTVKFSCYSIALNTGSEQTGVLPTGTLNEWDDVTVGVGTFVTGVAQASAAATLVLAAGDVQADDYYNGMIVYVCKTADKTLPEANQITNYDNGTNTCTVSAWGAVPDATYTYYILNTIKEMHEFTLTITLKYTEIGSGRNSSFDKFIPLLIDRELEFNIKFYKDPAGLIGDKLSQTLVSYIAALADEITMANTIAITECFVDKDNFGERSAEGIEAVQHDATLVGGESVYT